jgi:hypothetical protein
MVLGISGAAQAALIAYEPFDYALANHNVANAYGANGLTNCGGTTDLGLAGDSTGTWTNGWGQYAGSYDCAVRNYGLVMPAGGPASIGNEGTCCWTAYSIDRMLDTPVGDASGPQVIYASGLMNAYSTTMHFAQLQLRGDGEVDLNIGGWGGPGYGYNLNAGFAGAQIKSAQTLTLNQTYLFVCKIEFSGDANPDPVTLWIDPDLSAGEAGNVPEVDTDGGADIDGGDVYDRIALYGWCPTSFDELRVGTTWEDMSAVPEPATLGVLALGGMAVVIRRRRR